MNEIFDIKNFDVINDEENYYFFRALNNGDNNDIDNNITTNENGEINVIRTDRARYELTPKYSENSELSLEEIFDHIKMHHRTDTNCISLTTNANVALLYGREYYKDKYVMIKIPKNEIENKAINAGKYMINEINKRIDQLIKNDQISETTKDNLQKIDTIKTQEQLKTFTDLLNQSNQDQTDNMFEKGITYNYANTTSVDYQVLTKEQNLEKDKMIAKLNIIKENILPNVSNTFLIRTIGNAFSSLEYIHYNDIKQNEIIELPKEIVDIYSLLQQLPKDYPDTDKLKQELLKQIENKTINTKEFTYDNYHLNTENDYTIEKMYQLTNGNVDFYSAINLYKKSFYLSKSKLRTLELTNTLKSLLNNTTEYNDILNYLENNTYGVEPTIFSRQNSNKLKISESVSLDFSPKEQELFQFVNNLNESDLNYIINNPIEALKYYLEHFKNIKHQSITKEEYYANAIIDIFDWSKLGVVEFSPKHRNDLINKLLKNPIIEIYEHLKQYNMKEQEIANVLLTIVIKEKDLKEVELKDTFTAEQLDDFLGYYRVKNTKKLKLRSYQAIAARNINKTFKDHNFTAAILPTGAGKSYVALTEMLQYKDKEILYLAPNDVILNQIEEYIVENFHGETTRKERSKIIKEVFPNLKLKTYSSLLSVNEQYIDKHETINHQFDLIIFDELHRSGAEEWKKQIFELLNNQKENTKVLGITATPQRDMDGTNMADYWAEYFGYTEEEINKNKHLSIEMELKEAIQLGYVVNPKIVSCEYSLLNKNGLYNNLSNEINNMTDENKQKELIDKLDNLRRKLEEADGIEKVIGDNVKLGGRYIVFCPVTNNKGKNIEDEDGTLNDTKITGEDVIKKYTNELKGYLKNYYNLSDNEIDPMLEFHSMLGKYGSTINENELKKFEISNPNKIKFMIVMNKLNEGSHAKNDGLIWFRPLDENSKILFLQQLGRTIYATDPNKKTKDEKRPIVIDLPCNTVRVKQNKKEKTPDLERLKIIENWIIKRDGKIPNLNSSDKIESSYGSTLKRIQEKYQTYLNDPDSLTKLSKKQQAQTQEILIIGKNIDLWSHTFPEKIKQPTKSHNNTTIENDIFSITSTLKDYYDLKEEVDKYYGILDFEERIHEYIELLNTGAYQIKSYDPDNYFSDGTKINYLWQTNQIKIKQELNTNPRYQFGYETAKTTIKQYLEKYNPKIHEFIEILNTGAVEVMSTGKNNTYHFSDGKTMRYYWKRYRTNIEQELNTNPHYQSGYETAKITIKQYLEKYNPKIHEFIELLNTGAYQIKSKDSDNCFSDGTKINYFWDSNNEKIEQELNTNPRYQFDYETAKTAIKQYLENYNPKIHEFIEILNTGAVEVMSAGENNTYHFSDGKTMKGYWKRNRTNIEQELNNNPRYQFDYETAKTAIKQYLENYNPKIHEFIEILNTGAVEVMSAGEKNTYHFSDGKTMKGYWKRNRTNIEQELNNNPRYQFDYETAKTAIKQYLENYNPKIHEFIEILNTGAVEVMSTGENNTYHFSDGKTMKHYWKRHETDIEQELNNNPRYQFDYETAKTTIKKYLEKKNKIHEFIEILNTGAVEVMSAGEKNTYHFSDGKTMKQYWKANNNNEKIEKELNTNPQYETGYDTAKQLVKEVQEESRKKQNKKLVKELCEELDIDTKKHKSILNKSYEEVYAKTKYLQDHNLPIIMNDELHEIFFTADIHMQIKYNISLTNLIEQYTKDLEKGDNHVSR